MYLLEIIVFLVDEDKSTFCQRIQIHLPVGAGTPQLKEVIQVVSPRMVLWLPGASKHVSHIHMKLLEFLRLKFI